MGQVIVYCGGCGTRLREADFAAGKAHTSDNRAWCLTCRPAQAPTPRTPLRAVAVKPPSPEEAAPGRRRGVLVGVAVAGGAIAALLVALAVRPKSAPPAAPELAAVPAKSEIAPPPREEKAEPETLPAVAPPPAPAPAVQPAAPPPPPPPPPNQPPAVGLKAPTDGETFSSPAEVTMLAEASDPDGKVVRVEFLLVPIKLGEASKPPYTFTWRKVTLPGVYRICAKAVDDAGAETLSRPVRVTIVPEAVAAAAEPAAPPTPAKPAEPPPDKPVDKVPAKPAAGKAVKVDPLQLKVDEAIRKGAEFLKSGYVHPQYKELVLLTLLHAEVPETDPKFKQVLREALAFTEDGYSARTYNISLLAMVLEELDRVTYQKEIAKCAQFLADNQAKNGQWSYGTPTSYPKDFPTSAPKSVATMSRTKATAAKTAPPLRTKPPVKVQLRVKSQRSGPDHGDNSNAQYAALGLRACHDAGILLPKEVVERAWKWWVESQEPVEGEKESKSVATGVGPSRPRGWGYLSDGKVPGPGNYPDKGSMTAGAVGALCIYDHILGFDWKRDPAVRDGIHWMAQNFTVTANAKSGADWHYYYLYAIERIGMLYPTARIGAHDWYLEGAKYLLDAQQANGSWNRSTYHANQAPVVDTCFAILFLRRVTRPLQDVASVDPFKKR